MHSSDIKEEIQNLTEELDRIEEKAKADPQSAEGMLGILNTKILMLNVLTLNEVNWSMFYLKEELKEQNALLRTMKNSLNSIAQNTRDI